MSSLLGALMNRAPIPYVQRTASVFGGLLGGLNRADPEAQLRAMGHVGTLFAVVDRIASGVSHVDWRLYRSPLPGQPAEDRVEVTSHLALDVWRKPNPFMPQQEFLESITQHLELVGEAWWVVAGDERMRGVPLELWPVRPDRIEPVPSPTDFLTGYLYRSPDGEKIPLDLGQVIQLRRPHPCDPYRGIGAAQTLLAELDASRYSAEWNRNFFLNSAEPGGIIQVETRLGDDEFDEMVTRWNEQHRGVRNAHRVAVIEHGKYVPRAFSMRDMQFAELRAVTRDTILEAFGFPRPLLGITEDINRANAVAGEYVFSKWLLVTRLERIKQALNHEFLPLFGTTGRGVEFDYCSPVDSDSDTVNAERDSKVKALVSLVGAGFAETDVLEWLELPQLGYSRPTYARPTPPAPALSPTPDQGNLDA